MHTASTTSTKQVTVLDMSSSLASKVVYFIGSELRLDMSVPNRFDLRGITR
jgi:hypothetical protein